MTSKCNKNILFVKQNNNTGSDKLRVFDIVDNIDKKFKIKIITHEDFKDNIFKNSIVIWIKKINLQLIRKSKLNQNINIFDVVDNYLYKKQVINKLICENLLDVLIVNNNYMVNELQKKFNPCCEIIAIHHHWDQGLANCTTSERNKLKFGYAGSITSLFHTNNFLHFMKLKNDFPITFLNTESGKDVSNLIYDNKKVKSHKQVKFKMNFNFNCHISIRKINSDVFRYKTTAKIATAAYLNHNIITTYEDSIKDVLPNDYPFLLMKDDYDSIKKMFDIVINDYNGDKILWNKGLKMMQNIKAKLDIQTIIKEYEKLIQSYC